MKGVTTKDESLILIGAGLQKESADMCYISTPYKNYRLVASSYSDTFELKQKRESREDIVPAWSMAALWELLEKSNARFFEFSTTETSESVMNSLIWAVERMAKQNRLKYDECDGE